MKIKKKSAVLILSYLFAALLTAGGLALRQYNTAAEYRRYIEAGWNRSFDSLASSVYEMNTALHKSLYSTSPSLLGSACAEIYAKSLQAQESLGELPFSRYRLENTSGFIGRLGDYARALALKAYSEGLSDGDTDALADLSDSSELLSQNLIQLRADMDSGLLSVYDWQQALGESSPPSLGESVRQMNDEFPELPTLIYDGPYSRSVDEKTFSYIDALPEISRDEALDAAAEFTGLSRSVFDFTALSGGRLPQYRFSAAYDGGELSVAVTARGGAVTEMSCSAPAEYTAIGDDEAMNAARAFLSERGYGSMTDSYRIRGDNTLLINFAYSQDGVICYPDLVKVLVSLESGRVIGFEASGYLMNHAPRTLPLPIPEEDARACVSPRLSELSHSLAVIPSPGGGELFCHEFICENADGEHYIVYVNAVSGKEEKILILIEDENGTLTV